MSKHEEAALIILCAAVENYQTHLRFQEVLTIAEKLAFELRDVPAVAEAESPGVLIWVNPQASWNGMLARDLLLVQPMLYRDVRGTDMTIAHRLWRAICKANWIAIEPFPIAIELMDLAHVPTAWKRASDDWTYLYMHVRDVLERAQPLG
jgi:hypothetical protein